VAALLFALNGTVSKVRASARRRRVGQPLGGEIVLPAILLAQSAR
jgi:hypothetical protein